MKSDFLKINQLVEIELEDDSVKESMPSRVEEIKKDVLLLAMPIKKGVLFPIRIGENLKVFFRQQESTYAFYTKVIERKLGKISFLVVEHPKKYFSASRREYIRLPASLKVHAKFAGENEEIKEGVTIDISGGGALILLPGTSFNSGQNFNVIIEIPEKMSIVAKGKIIRVIDESKTLKGSSKLAVYFEEIKEGHRDHIIRFIFERQRELLKKGM